MIVVGDSYEVIGDTSHHLFARGSIIKAIEAHDEFSFLAVGYVPSFAKQMDRWVNVKDVKEIFDETSEEEVEQAIASIKSAMR